MLVPVILSGGAGTRLWPVSRRAYPKPFIRLPDGRSLLQRTLERAAGLEGVRQVLTVTNRDHYFQTRDEYAACRADGISFGYLLEPCGRNTAPAIGLAARRLLEQAGAEAVMLVLPADHLVEDEAAFAEAVARAERLARAGHLVTFGIRPDRPETGYGYIRLGAPLEDGGDGPVGHAVEAFVEKPDAETARRYLEDGGYLWNSGMFCFRADRILEAMGETAPELLEGMDACWAAADTGQEPLELPRGAFERLPDISVDYAVMEKARGVAVVPCELGWSDIGSWDALGTLVPADGAGNRVCGEAMLLDSSGCLVRSEGGRIVVGIGLDGLVVVDTPDAVLIAPRAQAQRVREVVERLRAAGHETVDHHRTVHRPWGTYTVLEEGERFKIKRIVVKPGASLSLQMHYHRSEHWVVVSGTARVTNGEREWLVRTNESTYIPAGTPHRLENPGVVPLVIIEVQSGEYLGEDDIVRFEDRYGRAPGNGAASAGGDGKRAAGERRAESGRRKV